MQKARSTKTWLDEFGVEEVDWPAESPDLIEHLWEDLEKRLQAQPSRSTSMPELTTALLDERAKIPIKHSKSCENPSQKSGSCYSCRRLICFCLLFVKNFSKFTCYKRATSEQITHSSMWAV